MQNENNEQVNIGNLVNIDDTAALYYLEVVKSEYEIERNKKQSFENRAGIILALLGAICIFLFEKVQLNKIFSLLTSTLNFLIFLKISSGILAYICFIFTTMTIIKTITVDKHLCFEVKNIDMALLKESRWKGVYKIINTYKKIIAQHKELNEKRAKAFKMSLYSIVITIFCIIIHLSTM